MMPEKTHDPSNTRGTKVDPILRWVKPIGDGSTLVEQGLKLPVIHSVTRSTHFLVDFLGKSSK
jgi:hypothetical protein